jgi:hypothetical protein
VSSFLGGVAKGALVTAAVIVGIALLPEELALAATIGLAALGAVGVAKLMQAWGTMTANQKAEAAGEFVGGVAVGGAVGLARGVAARGASAAATDLAGGVEETGGIGGSSSGETPGGGPGGPPESNPAPPPGAEPTGPPAKLGSSIAENARPAEQRTAQRLADGHAEFNGRTFEAPPPPDPGYDWTDDLGRTYDAMGDGTKAPYFKLDDFTNSIDSHLRKENDFTVIDATGYSADQVAAIKQYVDGLTPTQQAMIRRVGF